MLIKFLRDGFKEEPAAMAVIGPIVVMACIPVLPLVAAVELVFWTGVWATAERKPHVPRPPTAKELIAQAKQEYEREMLIANSHVDEDEKQAFAIGAESRYRAKLAQLTER